MNPKEKAKELLETYWSLFVKSDMDNLNAEQAKKLTKQCAIIAVDEILKVVPMYKDKYNPINENPKYKFWIEVKEELNKL